jgi:hypothetical protein
MVETKPITKRKMAIKKRVKSKELATGMLNNEEVM